MKTTRSMTRPGVAALVALGLLAIPTLAHASGFAVARFGGPHGNPVTENPSALYYNPAGIALGGGTQVMLDINWALRNGSYERGENALGLRTDNREYTEAEIAANTGTGEVHNFLYSPMIGVTTDFGTGAPFAVGAAFYAPFGGQAVWDTQEPVDGFPASENGAQRWYTIDGSLRTLAVTLGGAYLIEPARLSIGVSFNYYISEVHTIRARTLLGHDYLEQEGRSRIDVSGTDIGLGFGLMHETIEDKLWIGASYQSAPGFDGRSELEGTLTNAFPGVGEFENDISMTSQLPDILRLGVRYRPIRDVELRLFGDYTRWSRMEQQCIVDQSNLDGGTDIYDYCQVRSNGGYQEDAPGQIILNLERRWNDAAGVRLGGSYFLSDRIELMLDLGFDGNAIPDERLEPALIDMNKYSFGAGGMFGLTDFMTLGLTVTDIVYAERDTNGADTANTLALPSTQPSSEGVYNQNILVINTALYFAF